MTIAPANGLRTPPVRVVASKRLPSWQRRYPRLLILADSVAIAIGMAVGLLIRFGGGTQTVAGMTYPLLSLLLGVAWLLSLASCRAYELRFLGVGSSEWARVGSASVRLTALASFICVAARLDVARGFLAISLPLTALNLFIGRFVARRVLEALRQRGGCLHRVLVVGSGGTATELMNRIHEAPGAGLEVVGLYNPVVIPAATDAPYEVVAAREAASMAVELGADTIAVTAFDGAATGMLRRLAWALEGNDIDLVVAPALTDVAGPRVSIRPVAGLPLLHVEEPDIRGGRQVAKQVVERLLALTLLTLLAPLIGALALLVRLHSAGPAFFRQTRIGRGGREFTVYKLRTMRADAESLLASLLPHNEAADGVLFKIRNDPRVTRVGRWLRRTSLDELPQLWNVVKGDMALVGPRPPLPAEVAAYGDDVLRRLLVKPGITGLWQVSGRSELSWTDAVRLDLYYVENWSFALDAQILARTLTAVLQRRGAY